MSALGQKLPRPFQFSVSALPPITDTKQQRRRVRYGPEAGIPSASPSIESSWQARLDGEAP